MSIGELEARIDEIAADIARQKEVPKTLERSKSVVQRQINALRDPLGRLPVEISSEIFMQCLSTHPRAGRGHAPMLLANVCNGWRDIALSTPFLWAVLDAHEPMSDVVMVLETWLGRAGSQALSLSLPEMMPDGVAAVMERYGSRIQNLRMCHNGQSIEHITTAGPFPFLQTLTISQGSDRDPYPSDTLNVLAACPNLVHCTLVNVGYYSWGSYDEEPLVLPQVRLLNFITSSDIIVRHITLPGLQTLCISLYNPQNFLPFLRRSSPPLRHLILGNNRGMSEWTFGEMEECLSLLPTLTHFQLSHPTEATGDHFITLLASSPQLLPNLSTIDFQYVNPGPSWYQKLVSILCARRQQAHTVRVLVHYDSEDQSISEDVYVQLRQLVAEGMAIHVGLEDENYISELFNLSETYNDKDYLSKVFNFGATYNPYEYGGLVHVDAAPVVLFFGENYREKLTSPHTYR